MTEILIRQLYGQHREKEEREREGERDIDEANIRTDGQIYIFSKRAKRQTARKENTGR